MGGIEGDWELRVEMCPVPAKLTIKCLMGGTWMLACMVPKGNMMQCMMKKVDGRLELLKFAITKRLPPVEIIELESELADFFSVGVETIVREGDNLRLSRKGTEYLFSVDKNVKK
eukprot:GFUD01124045.1.p1 GENE.GFUD01124045.1~~GFUD01124045.1.p1  ORF type:complete len:115 (-),score=31.70 GFUD01124045.1:45-389(-)